MAQNKKEKQKVLFIAQEITPYLTETPLSVHGRAIPRKVQEKGYEVRTFMPKYGSINERRNQLHEVIRLSGMNVIIDDTDHPLIIKVATLQPERMQVYFIDCDDYFHHSADKSLEIHSDPEINDERAIFFVRGVIETVKKLRWEPAIVHCLGWVSALAPVFIKRFYQDDPTFSRSKVVYGLHADTFDGTLNARFAEKLKMNGFTDEDIASVNSEAVDYMALNRLAIDYADAVVQTSPDVDPSLVDYARQSGKPFMPYGESDDDQDYDAFYISITEE